MNSKKSIILGIVLFIVVLLLTGCMFYNLLKTNDFKEHFGALGYTIESATSEEFKPDSYLVASKEDVPYKIEYYEFNNEIDAKKAYEKYKKNIVKYITTDSKNKETTGAVFSKTVVNSTDEHLIISRVKNTLIFIAGTQDYAKEIDTLVEDIKY